MSRVVLITGATGGLGPAVIRRFLQLGDRVVAVLHDQDEAAARRTILSEQVGDASERLSFVIGDVTSEQSVEQFTGCVLRNEGRVDILLNIAGGYTWGKVASSSLADWNHMLDLNLTSAFLCCRALVGKMVERGWGRIINVASRAGLEGSSGHAAYSASKAGLLRLTESLAAETRGTGVTVNAVLPSTIDTPTNREDMPSSDFSKWVKPCTIAELVAFLASEEACATSGAGVPVYGDA